VILNLSFYQTAMQKWGERQKVTNRRTVHMPLKFRQAYIAHAAQFL